MSPVTRKSVKMVAELCNGTALWIPDTMSLLEDYSAVAQALHANKAFMVVAADPLSLIALKPPSEFGADAVVGWMQWFAVPMWAGGPAAVYLATSLKQVRRMPGRLIGELLDRLGNPTFRLTLQTREQHIRLDKATSNVCTAQVLLANMAAMYAVYHRTDGLKTIAKRVHGVSQLFASELAKLGVALPNGEALSDTVVFDVSPFSSADLVKALEAKHINLGAFDPKLVSASFDETHYPEDVHAIIAVLKEAGVEGTATPAQLAVDGKVPEAFTRTKPFLQQHIFNSIPSETEDVKENRPKGLVIVDIELVAVKSCKGPGSSGWSGWQSIVIETEYGDAWVDKADENSQRLETYDAMRKTTESEREAKDQIAEQANKYARNGGLRCRRALTWLSKIDPSTDPKVETDMLTVKMRLAKAIGWSHAKSGDDAEKPVSDDAKKALAEATQLLESVLEQSSKSSLTYEALKAMLQIRLLSHQVKEGREVLEKLQELSKENGKDDLCILGFYSSSEFELRCLQRSCALRPVC